MFLFSDSKTALIHMSQKIKKKKKKKKPNQSIFKEIQTFSSIRGPPLPPSWRISNYLKEPLSDVFSADKGVPSQGEQPLPHHQLQTLQTSKS